jgi:hypothetical protein
MLGTLPLDIESSSGAARREDTPFPLCTHRRSNRFGLEGLLEPEGLFLSRLGLRKGNCHGIGKHLVGKILAARIELHMGGLWLEEVRLWILVFRNGCVE